MCFLLILLSSLNWVRRNHFEIFYKTHIVCALLSFWSLYNHFELGKLDAKANKYKTPLATILHTT